MVDITSFGECFWLAHTAGLITLSVRRGHMPYYTMNYELELRGYEPNLSVKEIQLHGISMAKY